MRQSTKHNKCYFLVRDTMPAQYMLCPVSVCHKPVLYQNG